MKACIADRSAIRILVATATAGSSGLCMAGVLTVETGFGNGNGRLGFHQSSLDTGTSTAAVSISSQSNPTRAEIQELLDISPQSPAILNATAEARIGPGSIGVRVNSHANGQLAANSSGVFSYAFAYSSFLDTVTVTGDGSTARVKLQAEVLFGENFANWGNSMGSSQYSSSITYSWNGGGAVFSVCSMTVWVGCQNKGPGGLYSFADEIELAVGSEISIKTEMRASVSPYLCPTSWCRGTGAGGSDLEVNAWNSLRNGITVLTDGITLTAESGHDYVFQPHPNPNAVPVPGTLALAGVGLLLGLRTRRA